MKLKRILLFTLLLSMHLYGIGPVQAEDSPAAKDQGQIIPTETDIQDVVDDRDEEDDDDIYNDDEYEPEREEESIFGLLDAPHNYVSQGVETMAKYMDIFFADEKIYQEATSSYARFTLQTIFDSHGDVSTPVDLRLKIDLPKTKKKLKLVIESETERGAQAGADGSSTVTPAATTEKSDFYAALQKTFPEKKGWNARSSIGMKIDAPLNPFVRYRVFRDTKLGLWKFHFAETLFWFKSSGIGSSTLFEFDRALTRNVLFRSSTNAIWEDNRDYYEMSHTFALFHELSNRRAVAYSITVFGDSDPTVYATSYLARVSYRQLIHKDWLFLEVRPEMLYERETNFDPEPSLSLQLEMVFGNKYL